MYFVYFFALSSLACFFSSFIKRPVVVNLVSFAVFSLMAVLSGLLGLSSNLIDNRYAPDATPVWGILFVLLPSISFGRVYSLIALTTVLPGNGITFSWAQLADPGPGFIALPPIGAPAHQVLTPSNAGALVHNKDGAGGSQGANHVGVLQKGARRRRSFRC